MAEPEGFVMPAIALRQDFDAAQLRALARASKNARQVRRLPALAAVYDGAGRGEAAALSGMDWQILRDWALRFNADGPDGLIDRKAPGAKPKLTPEQLPPVVQLVEDGPMPAIHGVFRWRLVDLVGWIYDEYGVSLDPSRLGRLLKGLGYALLSARPKHHAQVESGHHAVVLLDQAGWHISEVLRTPTNITLLPLPSKAPELNPVENLWQFMCENHLSNRIFQNYEDIVDHCCEAWNKVADQPWRIMSIGLRGWAHGF